MVLLAWCRWFSPFRLVLGPSLPDRIVALDLLTLLAVGVIALFAIRENSRVLLDAAIGLALVAFPGDRRLCAFPGTARPAWLHIEEEPGP